MHIYIDQNYLALFTVPIPSFSVLHAEKQEVENLGTMLKTTYVFVRRLKSSELQSHIDSLKKQVKQRTTCNLRSVEILCDLGV